MSLEKENPLISIIMPAYNTEKYIREAIESILCQTASDFELLICDDGSTDGTVEVIQSFTDQRIRFFQNKKNSGNLHTSNFLFSKCTGDFITIQDADDFSAPNRLEVLLNAFDQEPELGLVGSFFEAVNADRIPLFCGFLPTDDQEIKAIMQKEVVPMLYASIMIRREVIDKVGLFRDFFNRKGYADFDLMSRCAEISPVKNIPKILYFYRKHETSFNTYFHKYSKKDLLLKHMDVLLLQAHRLRLNNKKDFFEMNDLTAMKKVLSDWYLKAAESFFWENKISLSKEKIKVSLKLNPFNWKSYRTLLFIYRKS
jgi:glycosyltransferase involved in cell wall biosynthesis